MTRTRSGTATIAAANNESIVVVFSTPLSVAPQTIDLTPETSMPGWVDLTTVTRRGFTIQLAGPGPVGTKFFYRASL